MTVEGRRVEGAVGGVPADLVGCARRGPDEAAYLVTVGPEALDQVAILGPGAVVKRPVVIDDPNLGETIAVRYMVYLALTYDHQLVDGADAGRFLREVKQRLEAGQFEV